MKASETTISDDIVAMYEMASILLCTHDGILTDWEIRLLSNFVVQYWSDK
tara:strand:- start:1736 stop:1885 length:150 start_codon:yes stop_codon:yes gene_type:complete